MYRIVVFKNGCVYDRTIEPAEWFSISTYIREMLAYGYGLDITFQPVKEN